VYIGAGTDGQTDGDFLVVFLHQSVSHWSYPATDRLTHGPGLTHARTTHAAESPCGLSGIPVRRDAANPRHDPPAVMCVRFLSPQSDTSLHCQTTDTGAS